jgi:hypothetical protein
LHGIDDIGQVGFAILSLIGSTFLQGFYALTMSSENRIRS